LEDDPSLFLGWTEHADKTKTVNRKTWMRRGAVCQGELFVCMQCAKEAIQNCKNVLGYLTMAEHCGYRRDATMCNILFLDGYAVILQAQWEIALFLLHEFFKR
jgi:hypothetical protein